MEGWIGWAEGYAGTVDMVSKPRPRDPAQRVYARLVVDPPGLPYAAVPGRPQQYQDTVWVDADYLRAEQGPLVALG